jgi:very-short-patch-repair endonuclease
MVQARKYPRDFLLAELKHAAKVLGKIPTMEEFRQESKVSPETLVKRFKGWKGALSSAGFDPSKERLTYQDIDMIEELKRVANQLGRTPSTTEFDELRSSSSPSASTISQRFGGSWEKACRAAGLEPFVSTKPRIVVGGWNKGKRKLKVSKDDLEYFYEVEGLSASAIATRQGVSAQTVLRLMRDHGIEVKKLHYSMPRATSIEEMIYRELQRRGVTFVKQQVIDGLWVADALIPGARVVIECDGEYWHSRPEMQERDQKKDRYLISRGYKVVRFPEAAIRGDVRSCVQRVVDLLIDRYKKD